LREADGSCVRGRMRMSGLISDGVSGPVMLHPHV
jgi:hypothetical protein